ncbi:hypothetical protein [Staphylococcus equorum]|uniref:hypothetical protein n=1 Tax=Staphylococcus equorum TaxID=246432 RepID=UPI00114CE50F|nr:hypothetical protein [Staphylococcus equorum]
MKIRKEPMILYDDSGSREDIDIYLQRIEELQNQHKDSSQLLIKTSLALVIIATVSLFALKYINNK